MGLISAAALNVYSNMASFLSQRTCSIASFCEATKLQRALVRQQRPVAKVKMATQQQNWDVRIGAITLVLGFVNRQPSPQADALWQGFAHKAVDRGVGSLSRHQDNNFSVFGIFYVDYFALPRCYYHWSVGKINGWYYNKQYPTIFSSPI